VSEKRRCWNAFSSVTRAGKPGSKARRCRSASTTLRWAAIPSASADIGGRARRGDDRLSHGPDSLTQRAAAALVELRERVVEEQQRRHAASVSDQLCLGEEKRQDGEALLALRAERPQVAVAALDADLVEVRADAGRAALDVAREPLLELRDRGRSRVVAERDIVEAELARALREAGLQELDHVAASRVEHRPEIRDLCRPRGEHLPLGDAHRDPAQRGIPLAHGGGVVDRHVRSRRVEPAERAVDVGTPGGRSALDDDQAVGGEDEGGELAAELLGGAEHGAVEAGALRLRRAEAD